MRKRTEEKECAIKFSLSSSNAIRPKVGDNGGAPGIPIFVGRFVCFGDQRELTCRR